MRIDALPSPGVLNHAHALRSVAAQAISYGEIMAARSVDSTTLADLDTFFTACAVACRPGSLIVCVYPLDALVGDLTPLGMVGKLVMTNLDQTGTYTYQGALGADASYGATTAGALATGARIEFSTGDKTVEVGVAIDALSGTNAVNSGVLAAARFYDATGAGGAIVQVLADEAGTFATSVSIVSGGSPSSVYLSEGDVTAPATIGVGVSGGVLSVWLDGAPIVLSSSAVPDADLLPLLTVTETAGLDAVNAGGTAALTLRTASADFVHTYAARTDACGNSVAA